MDHNSESMNVDQNVYSCRRWMTWLWIPFSFSLFPALHKQGAPYSNEIVFVCTDERINSNRCHQWVKLSLDSFDCAEYIAAVMFIKSCWKAKFGGRIRLDGAIEEAVNNSPWIKLSVLTKGLVNINPQGIRKCSLRPRLTLPLWLYRCGWNQTRWCW